jgi:hypothetical protein
MKPLSKEWVNKAEGDYATAQRELQIAFGEFEKGTFIKHRGRGNPRGCPSSGSGQAQGPAPTLNTTIPWIWVGITINSLISRTG